MSPTAGPRGARPRPPLPQRPINPPHPEANGIRTSSCQSLGAFSSSALTDSKESVTTSSCTSSWACHSTCSSRSSFLDMSDTTSTTNHIPARPLPRLPPITSIPCVSGPPFSSTPASPSPSAYTFPRPLPRPPQQPFLFERARTNSSSSARMRPLPVPRATGPAPLAPSEDVTLSYLRVDIPGSSPKTYSIETPISPSTPLVFSKAGCSASSDAPSQSETLAKSMGYVGVEPPSEDASTDPHDTDATDSSSESECHGEVVFTKDRTTLRSAQSHHNVHITVELVPSKNYSQRGSRVWMRERRGRRWVEDDYAEILRELRKL